MGEINLTILILISIPEAMLIASLGLHLLGIKPTLKQITAVGLFQALCSYVIRLFPLTLGVSTILQLISFSILNYLVMFVPYKISFLAILLGLSIYASIEAVSASLLLHITGLSIPNVLENTWLRLTFFLSEAVFMIVIIFLINRYRIRLPKIWLEKIGINREAFNKYYPFVTLFLFQVLLLTVFYLSTLFQNSRWLTLDDIFSFHFLVLILIAVMPIAIIKLIKKIVTLLENEIETKSQLFTFHQIEDLLKTIRIQRHNFNHDLQVMYGLLEVEAFHEAKEYIRSGMKEVAATSEMVKTDNLGITALLHAKTGIAEGKNIRLNIYVNTSLQKLPVNNREANIILGSLIDNALEAVDGLPVDKKEVQVVLGQDLNGYTFEVINYGLPIGAEMIDRIFDAGFSTKGPGRGMGLYGVKKLLEKHKGYIIVSSNAESTSFKISIPQKNSR